MMKKTIWIFVGLVFVVVSVLVMQKKPGIGSEVAGVDSVEQETVPADHSIDSIDEFTPTNDVPNELSDAVLTLVGEDADYQTKIKAMRELGYEIAPQNLDQLMEYLAVPMPEDAKMKPLAFNAIRNDVMDILLRQKQLPEGIGELLANVYNDPNHDEMWRNYCVQFMEPFYEKLSKETAPKDRGSSTEYTKDSEEGVAFRAEHNDELTRIRETLWSALDERDNSNAGTALLAMDKLSRNHEAFDLQEISAAMIDLANDEQASLANRVTALRLCGERGNVDALDIARNLAEHGETTMLRCAAIATLGELGAEEDLDLIRSYTESSNERIQKIALNALQKHEAE